MLVFVITNTMLLSDYSVMNYSSRGGSQAYDTARGTAVQRISDRRMERRQRGRLKHQEDVLAAHVVELKADLSACRDARAAAKLARCVHAQYVINPDLAELRNYP